MAVPDWQCEGHNKAQTRGVYMYTASPVAGRKQRLYCAPAACCSVHVRCGGAIGAPLGPLQYSSEVQYITIQSVR